MMDRISTLSLQQTSLRYMNNLQTDLVKVQTQISSGVMDNSYTELASTGQLEQVNGFQGRLQQLSNYTTNNTLVQNNIDSSSAAINNLIDVASGFQNLITTARSSAGSNAPVGIQGQSALATIADNLNTSLSGVYIFGGSQISTPPVKDIVNISNVIDGQATDNYYSGDDTDLKINNSDNLQLVYNVKADNPAFQQLIAGIHIAMSTAGGSVPAGSTADSQYALAYTMVNKSISSLVAIKANLTNMSTVISQTNTSNQNIQQYLNQFVSAATETDIPTATIKATQDQTTLEATYQLFAKLSQLTLSKYL